MTVSELVHSIFGASIRPSIKRGFSDTSQEDTSTLPPVHLDTSNRPPYFTQPQAPKGLSDSTRGKRNGDQPLEIAIPKESFSATANHCREISPPTPSPSQYAGSKRSLGGIDVPSTRSKRHKRPRLDFPNILNLTDLRGGTGPLSPLFFSNSVHQRPAFPPRFSSSEAAAKMLSRAKGEDGGNVRTVKLARGSYLGHSGPTSMPQNRHRGSSDHSPLPRRPSSEQSERIDQLHLLHQVGITELLDHDDRPTFIVDLADGANFNSNVLSIVYGNHALHSCGALLDMIQGKAESVGSSPSTPKTFHGFREWVLESPTNSRTYGEAQPTYYQASISWGLSTLRNRFRVISGTLLSEDSRRASSNTFSSNFAALPEGAQTPSTRKGSAEGHSETLESTGSSRYQESQDYFGSMIGSVRPPRSQSRHDSRIAEPHPSPRSGPERFSDDHESAHDLLNKDTAFSSDDSNLSSVLSAATAGNVDLFAHGASLDNVGFFDWTRLPNDENLPEHIRFARSIDWSSSKLGPIELWSPDLRQMVNLIMASPHPAAMYWGPDLVAIYNEAYVSLAGSKHPTLMGQKYSDAWAEIWDDVKEVFASAQSTGQATMKDDDCLFILRSDVLEETYFSWSIIPMVGADGRVMGLYNPAFEKTRRKIAERRMLTLREVGERTATARDVRAFWSSVLAALECNEYDTPFVLLYSLAEDDSSEGSSVTDGSTATGIRQCYLEGSLGVPTGHVAAPEAMDLRASMEGFAPVFRDAMAKGQTLVLDPKEHGEVARLIDGLEWRGFGDPSKLLVVVPIHPTTGENTLGFLVLGVNPRRPYDDDYSLFLQLLSRQLATSLASVVLFEEEIRRGQRAAKMAALDRIELSEQLAARTQEAIDSETRFTRMAEFAPVGMFIADAEGQITFCNDTWYDITRVPRSLHFAENWVDYVLDSDVSLVTQLWHDLVDNRKPVSTEFRFRAPWIDKGGVTGETWVLFSAYPETNEDGSLKSVFGSITNISSQKWAEGLQKRKMEEAVELKRQQENFIDITSHEMRNPLSAILQCADEIATSLSEAKVSRTGQDVTLLDNNIDAAQTIALCAQHQKRIVDDVLTMSKIDSALLMVTPVDAQPLTVIQRALKMFEGELLSADIEMIFRVDPSFERLSIDWVRFDPSRVMQVLINLTTNAIKFTTAESRRAIAVSLAASKDRPSLSSSAEVKYIPKRANRVDMMLGNDWGTGEEVYIHFSVKDTGRGLSEEEKKSLFMRFSQASPRTHVQYGGSGLGLFISRELTELQGGEIGVASKSGEGSTFAFFVKARRSKQPVDPTEVPPTFVSRRSSDGKGTAQKMPVTKVRDFGQTDALREHLKVLLVEDNLVNQRVLQKQLRKQGCDVHVANHGREALDKIQKSGFWKGNEGRSDCLDFRVVLMDQEMPILDGISATKQIRQLEKDGHILRHVPILGITANARQEQIQELIEAGMDDVVSKPFRIPEILPKVEELSAKYEPLPNPDPR